MMDPRRGNPRGQKRPAEGNFDWPGQSQGYRDEGRRGCDNILSADGQRKMSGIIRRRKIEDSGRWTGLREDNGSKVDKVTLVFQLVTTIGREPRIFRGGEVLRSIEGVGRMWRWTGIRRGGGGRDYLQEVLAKGSYAKWVQKPAAVLFLPWLRSYVHSLPTCRSSETRFDYVWIWGT
jgi:hypothetical protein